MNYLLFFGTFNPITKAHLAMIEQCKKTIGGKAFVIPSNLKFMDKWKKVDHEFLSDEERIDLISTARSSPSDFEIILEEVNESVTCRTIDTVKYIMELVSFDPDVDKMYLCMGADKIPELNKWYKAQELFKMCALVALDRDISGCELLKQILGSPADEFVMVNMPKGTSNISSTQIRQAYYDGNLDSVKECLPNKVYKYLKEKKHG